MAEADLLLPSSDWEGQLILDAAAQGSSWKLEAMEANQLEHTSSTGKASSQLQQRCKVGHVYEAIKKHWSWFIHTLWIERKLLRWTHESIRKVEKPSSIFRLQYIFCQQRVEMFIELWEVQMIFLHKSEQAAQGKDTDQTTCK